MARGTLFVVSGPSGAGKRTVLSAALAQDNRLCQSVSATTRAPRAGEADGVDYFFIGRDDFEKRVAAGEFVEWAAVHGNLYGTLRSELHRLLESGKDAILELDVQGMRNVKRARPDAVSIFIMPPSLEALEERIRARGANSAEDTAVRLRNARNEMAARDEFDHVVVNDSIGDAVKDFVGIVQACRQSRADS